VVSVGPGKLHPETGKVLPNPCKVGDVVLLPRYTKATECTYQGENHFFVDADELLGSFAGGEVTAAAFRPFGDRIMVFITMMASETASGIAIAAAEDEESNQGEVFAVGPGTYSATGDMIAMDVKAGQSVLFKSRATKEIRLGGQKFKLGSASDVLSRW